MLAGKAQKSTVAPPATGKREGSSLVPEAVKRAKTSDNETVRIWWPPTESKKKGGFSGMYWPATVLRIMADTCEVVYDNGDKEIVEAENVFPVPPVGFGEESSQFMVGEYVEVSNDSTTDPAAWLAQVTGVEPAHCTVSFPFHDEPTDVVEYRLLRRARIFQVRTNRWQVVKPLQTWEDGEVTSPLELDLCSEAEVKRLLAEHLKATQPACSAEGRSSGKRTSQSPGRARSGSSRGKARPPKEKDEGPADSRGPPRPDQPHFRDVLRARLAAQERRQAVSAKRTAPEDSSQAGEAGAAGPDADDSSRAGPASKPSRSTPRSSTPLDPPSAQTSPPSSPGRRPERSSERRPAPSTLEGTRYRREHQNRRAREAAVKDTDSEGQVAPPGGASTRSGRVVKPKTHFEINYAQPQLMRAEDKAKEAAARRHAAEERHHPRMDPEEQASLDAAMQAGLSAAKLVKGMLPPGWCAAGRNYPPGTIFAPANLGDGMRLMFTPAILTKDGKIIQLNSGVEPAGIDIGAAVAATAAATAAGKEAMANARPHSPDTSPGTPARGKKSGKTKRQPGEPTPAKNGYLIFSARHRDRVHAENPHITMQEVTSRIGAMWKQASKSEKDNCNEEAARDRQRYEEERIAWVRRHTGSVEAESPPDGNDTAATDAASPPVPELAMPEPPAQWRTANMLFTLEFRKALGRNVPLEQATALAAGAWNGLSKEKRAPYEHISSVEKINYDHAMAVYQKKLADIVPQPNGLPSSSAPGAQPQHAPSPYLTNPATGLPYGATAAATISLPFSQSHAAPTPLHHGSAAPHPPVPAAAVHRLRPQASLLPRPTYRPHNGYVPPRPWTPHNPAAPVMHSAALPSTSYAPHVLHSSLRPLGAPGPTLHPTSTPGSTPHPAPWAAPALSTSAPAPTLHLASAGFSASALPAAAARPPLYATQPQLHYRPPRGPGSTPLPTAASAASHAGAQAAAANGRPSCSGPGAQLASDFALLQAQAAASGAPVAASSQGPNIVLGQPVSTSPPANLAPMPPQQSRASQAEVPSTSAAMPQAPASASAALTNGTLPTGPGPDPPRPSGHRDPRLPMPCQPARAFRARLPAVRDKTSDQDKAGREGSSGPDEAVLLYTALSAPGLLTSCHSQGGEKARSCETFSPQDAREGLRQAGISQAGYEKLEEAWGEGSPLHAAAQAALQKWIFGRTPTSADWKSCLSDIFGAKEAEALFDKSSKNISNATVIDLT